MLAIASLVFLVTTFLSYGIELSEESQREYTTTWGL
jgi:hypothetical protein